jgi:hypothetical protein
MMIINMDYLNKSPTTIIVSALKTLKLGEPRNVFLAALGLIFRRIVRKKSLLITKLNHAGRTEGQNSNRSVDDEFNTIIAGGGKPFEAIMSLSIPECMKVMLVVCSHLVYLRIRLYVLLFLKLVAGNLVRGSCQWSTLF